MSSPTKEQSICTRRGLLLGGGAALLHACTPPSDLRRGEQGVVARISDGDLISLNTGLRVRLSEIEAPSPYGDGAPYGEEARTLIEREALGRTATLYYGGLSRDRYERALAHVFIADEIGRTTWLNGLMIAQGAARVRTYPDNTAKALELYALEAKARAESKGLWALDAYRVRTPDDWPSPEEPRAFILAEGRLAGLNPSSRYGELHRSGSSLSLTPPTSLSEAAMPQGLQPGASIRIRGRTRIQEDDSVTIDFSHWPQLEVLAS